MDRSGGRASAGSMESVLGVLRRGELLGIFPEGTRSVDGRLYKGKTGVARLVLQANVPVIPVGFVHTQWRRTPSGFRGWSSRGSGSGPRWTSATTRPGRVTATCCAG